MAEETWIVEINPDGHRLWYVRLLIDAAYSAGRRHVLYTSQRAVDSAEWVTHLASSPGEVRIIEELHWRTLLATAREAGAHVIVPDADTQLARLAVAARVNRRNPRDHSLVTALVMRPLKQPGARGTAALALKVLLAVGARARLTSIDFVALASDSRRIGLMTRFRLADIAQDPVVVNPLAVGRRRWLVDHAIRPDRAVVTILGDVSTRKYTPQVLAAFDQLPSSTALDLVLVGRPDAASLRALDNLSRESLDHVHLFSGYVPDIDFDSWIAYSDAVMVMHRNAGSSGVLLKSAALRTPVIVGGHKSVTAAAMVLGGPYETCETTVDAIANKLLELKPREDQQPAAHVDLRGFADQVLGI